MGNSFETNVKEASIQVVRHWLFSKTLKFYSTDKCVLLKANKSPQLFYAGDEIFSYRLNYHQAKYKNQPVNRIYKFLERFPVVLDINGWTVRLLPPVYKDLKTASYTIEVQGGKIGTLTTSFPFLWGKEKHEIEVFSDNTEHFCLSLFALMYMYCELNDSSGT